ncbi:hypothetical protein PSI15_13010 [Xenorhabdus sp. PR6a]|uniref:hypothetical protein n=1 Tax=Xenorhabdus sp. PR6a TaxID=3025877 RepID=UPI0023586A71|nr:hypothetical protein [Xenorhabdus sp. PR6a]MDC9582472.1 hypothetical protein [Xenorhabdus sp. PR6a]
MTGLEVMALLNPDTERNIASLFSDISCPIERPFSDFDRSHSKSISQKQSADALEKINALMDIVKAKIEESKATINTISFGSDEEIRAIDVHSLSSSELNFIANEVDNGISRLLYVFFMADLDPVWQPHLLILKQMKHVTIDNFIEYRRLTLDIAMLVKQYEDVEYCDDEIEFSKEDTELFKKSIENSHMRFGLEPSKWKSV